MAPRPPPLPAVQADRMKASRIRSKMKFRKPLSPEEAAWFTDYEAAKTAGAAPVGGRSAREKRTVHIEEERGASEGHGSSAAAEAAAAAAFSHAEGQREDSLAKIALETYRACVGDLRETLKELRKRASEDGVVVRDLLRSVREHYLARTELEADAIRASSENKDELTKLAEMLAPLLGLQIPGAVNGKKAL